MQFNHIYSTFILWFKGKVAKAKSAIKIKKGSEFLSKLWFLKFIIVIGMSAISETEIYPNENSELILLIQINIFSIEFDSIILKLFRIDTSMYSM